MEKIEGLIERARRLKEKGLTTGEISDELNVSRDTALWLISRAREDVTPPSDIYIEWRNLSSPFRLRNIATTMADMILEAVEDEPEVVIGIATSGVPIATMIAEELDVDLGIYYPKKLREETGKDTTGFFSGNYSTVNDKKCVAIDDIVTSGNTLRELARNAKKKDGEVLCAAVIIDKMGLTEIEGFPVLSSLKIMRL
ncbi:MAG: orotate phosphoribosyltransferase-like protein [Archaeoglobaceae archaeon]